LTKPDFVMNMHLKKIQIHLHPEQPALKHLLDTDERFPAVFDKLAELEASGEPIEVCLACDMPEKECICQ